MTEHEHESCNLLYYETLCIYCVSEKYISNCYNENVYTAQAPSTGNSKMDIAYRRYGKRHGEEALLAWKRKKKRIAATVKLIESGKDPTYNAKHLQYISKLEQKEDFLPYPDCYVPDCGAESLPHSGYCYKRILYLVPILNQ